MKLLILSALVGLCAAGALPQFYRNSDLYNRNLYNPFYNYNQAYQQLRPRSDIDATAAIIRSDSETGDNGFRYAYETTNGIRAEASGVEANGIQSQGSYSYTGDDGQVYSVRYTAGADGFRPEGAHLPTAPPVPEAIARALEQNARDEASGIFDDGSYKEGKYDAYGNLRSQLYNNVYNRPFNYNYNKYYNRNY